MIKHLAMTTLGICTALYLSGCTKADPILTSTFAKISMLQFQESIASNNLNTVTLTGSCIKDVTFIEIQVGANAFIDASTVVSAGSDLNCSDGTFSLILDTTQSSLVPGLSADGFRANLRGGFKKVTSATKTVLFYLAGNSTSRVQADLGRVQTTTTDAAYKMRVSISNEIQSTTTGSEKVRVRIGP